MTLNEQDKSDLLGLVSGLGTTRSQNRARQLTGADPGAAEYVRQMRMIADAFRPPLAVLPDQELSARQADALTDAVLARVGRAGGVPHRPALGTAVWRLPAVGAAAAVVVMAFSTMWVTWTVESVDRSHSFGGLVWVPRGYAGAPPYERGGLLPGQMVSAENGELARITLSNGSRALLDNEGRLWVGPDGCSFELYQGSLLISTRKWSSVRAKGTTFNLREGQFQVQILPSRICWFVLSGRATLSVPTESRDLVAGQEALWDEARAKLTVGPLRNPVPNRLDE